MNPLVVACLVAGAVAIGWPGRRVAEPRRVVFVVVGVCAAGGLVIGGPVLAVVAAVYAGLGGRALLQRAARRRIGAARAAAIAGLAGLAADLRAGVTPTGPPKDGHGDGRIGRLASSVWRLAERTGAPAADLVERIEADARAAARAESSAAAQAAGAQATAMLLAGLPVGGIVLGGVIGADPIQVLLHTRLGAACAIGGVLLQGAGLIWADRLVARVAR